MGNAAQGKPGRRLPTVILLVVFFIVAMIVGLVVAFVLALFNVIDRAPAHVCALALVRRSPVAIRLVGSPVEQRGFTGGRTSFTNGEEFDRVTFWVRGPLGEAFVVSEGHRSPLGSHLDVRIGRNGESQTVYSGPFDCSELHTPANEKSSDSDPYLNPATYI